MSLRALASEMDKGWGRTRCLATLPPALVVWLFLCGCTVQLAPAYDQSIYDGLVSANKDIQALFVATDTSVTSDTYATRAPAYDHIVAELKAVELQIKARPLPSPGALEETNKVLTKLGVGGVSADPKFSDSPSARSVEDLERFPVRLSRIRHGQDSGSTRQRRSRLITGQWRPTVM